MFGWLIKKKEVEQLKEEIKNSFEAVKNDLNNAGKWITHLHDKHNYTSKDIELIREDLSTVKNEVWDLRELVSLLGYGPSKRVIKTTKQVFNKQTAVEGVQTPVQIPIQTGKFYGISNLSLMERAIVWVLVNSDMKLSYDDLAAMLGKDRVTIRGQINTIKRKSEGLIFEQIEKNGKKRLYVPDEIKVKLLKSAKVKISSVNSRKGKRKE